MKKSLYIFMFLLVFSCKKEKLEGEKEILIGKWEWVYTKQYHEYPVLQTEAIITPNSIAKTYSLEFLKKGKVFFYENGKCIDKRRIISFDGYGWSGNEWGFSIRLNKKDEDQLNNFSGYVYVQNDSVIIRAWDFPFMDDGLSLKRNYFVKEI